MIYLFFFIEDKKIHMEQKFKLVLLIALKINT